MLRTVAKTLRCTSWSSQVRWLSVAPSRRAGLQGGDPTMMCFQCEQTENGTGCTVIGVCGKTPVVAALQDDLVNDLKHLSLWAHRARSAGLGVSEEANRFTLDALFATLTNVNFDEKSFREKYLPQCHRLKQEIKTQLEQHDPKLASEVIESQAAGVLLRRQQFGEEVSGLQELVTYGLKGVAAYGAHALLLGQENPAVYAEIHRLLALVAEDADAGRTPESLLGAALDVGKLNLTVMSMLDAGHTGRFGHPVPTQVATSASPGKCILVSGHDLHDLEQLLQQTEGTGIDVYTHGEMLPAHGYPQLKKYKHLRGNYGSQWSMQKFEFSQFPGPVIMTTNCLVEPRKSYKDRLFTVNAVSWPGCAHIESDAAGNKDFSKVIEMAKGMPGFTDKNLHHAQGPDITVGFGHQTLISVADKILAAVKSGEIKRFFVIGGCDGSELSRSYFRDLAMSTPRDSVILTMGCGKFRFIKQQRELGMVESLGVPRVLDMGQCNDSYGAVLVALELAKALNCGVNDLPLSFAISWFEQKAVAVLLTLLHLGIKDIAIGPNLPAFVAPPTLEFLNKNLGLRPTNVDSVPDDLEQFYRT